MIRLITTRRLRALEEELTRESEARAAAEADLRIERMISGTLEQALTDPGTVVRPAVAAGLGGALGDAHTARLQARADEERARKRDMEHELATEREARRWAEEQQAWAEAAQATLADLVEQQVAAAWAEGRAEGEAALHCHQADLEAALADPARWPADTTTAWGRLLAVCEALDIALDHAPETRREALAEVRRILLKRGLAAVRATDSGDDLGPAARWALTLHPASDPLSVPGPEADVPVWILAELAEEVAG